MEGSREVGSQCPYPCSADFARSSFDLKMVRGNNVFYSKHSLVINHACFDEMLDHFGTNRCVFAVYDL